MSQCYLYKNCNHIDCNSFCVKKFKLDYLYDEAMFSDFQRTYMSLYIDDNQTDLEEFNRLKVIQDNILTFVSRGDNLYLCSKNCGCGKTSWALRLVQEYFNKIWPKCKLECKALFINVPKYLLAIKDNITEKSEYVSHIKENILDCDIVIWDDICNKFGTEFELTNLLNIIDYRISHNKSNIYTSNILPNDLKQYMGDRLESRIANCSEIIELKGNDKRQLK